MKKLLISKRDERRAAPKAARFPAGEWAMPAWHEGLS